MHPPVKEKSRQRKFMTEKWNPQKHFSRRIKEKKSLEMQKGGTPGTQGLHPLIFIRGHFLLKRSLQARVTTHTRERTFLRERRGGGSPEGT